MKNAYASVYRSDVVRKELMAYYDRILQNWPVPYEEKYVETRSGKTHILLCGNVDGRPLLLFHGTGNNSLMWRYNVEALGKHFRLHLIDTINDPGKSQAAMDFNPEPGYACWIEEVMDALGIRKALLVGYSKGGWIALNTAIHSATRVEKVVLLAPAAGINASVKPGFMLKSLRVGLLPSMKAIESYVRYLSGSDTLPQADYVEYLYKLVKGTRLKMVAHRKFSDDELKNLDVPVMLLFGENEISVAFRKVVERAEACIRQLTVHIAADAGHALPGEKPDVVNELIIRHLQH